MPLHPFFSNLQHTQPLRRAHNLHACSNLNSCRSIYTHHILGFEFITCRYAVKRYRLSFRISPPCGELAPFQKRTTVLLSGMSQVYIFSHPAFATRPTISWSFRCFLFSYCHNSKYFAHLKFLRGLKSKKSQVLKISLLLHQRAKSCSYSVGVRLFSKSRYG